MGCALLACATPTPPATPPAEDAGRPAADARDRAPGFGETLAALADDALAAGDLDTAENRYRRLLSRDARSVPARIGLARVARARGRHGAAREQLEAALVVDPGSAEAHLGLAELASDPEAARALLLRALERAPRHPAVLARLAEVTGRAPRRATSLEDALALSDAHPLDPAALLDAGRWLVRADRADEARPRLELVVTLSDLDPDASREALALLREIDAAWSGRRFVPVRVFVDAALREHPGWRFRQRRLWLDVSVALAPLLETVFVPVSFEPFDAAPSDASLDARLRGLVYRTRSVPEEALFAAFTAERTPSRAGAKRGVASYLGRQLFVRDAADEPLVRVLAHEILHVYGGIHVAEDLPSLMNPTGESSRIDPLNADIVRTMASRGFGRGGYEQNVLPRIPIAEATDAFTRALQLNLAFREAGLDVLLGDATSIGPGAAARAREMMGLDAHLADVSRFVARLYWESERRVKAVAMLELASELYGRQSPQGRAMRAQADVLRRRLRFELGVP